MTNKLVVELGSDEKKLQIEEEQKLLNDKAKNERKQSDTFYLFISAFSGMY